MRSSGQGLTAGIHHMKQFARNRNSPCMLSCLLHPKTNIYTSVPGAGSPVGKVPTLVGIGLLVLGYVCSARLLPIRFWWMGHGKKVPPRSNHLGFERP